MWSYRWPNDSLVISYLSITILLIILGLTLSHSAIEHLYYTALSPGVTKLGWLFVPMVCIWAVEGDWDVSLFFSLHICSYVHSSITHVNYLMICILHNMPLACCCYIHSLGHVYMLTSDELCCTWYPWPHTIKPPFMDLVLRELYNYSKLYFGVPLFPWGHPSVIKEMHWTYHKLMLYTLYSESPAQMLSGMTN